MVRRQIQERGVQDPRIVEAFLKVPRHLFVPPDERHRAYEDHPIHIGWGQTISQPYMVALMTEMLDVGERDKVLDVGTGSGYQAAILAELAGEVHTVERIGELSEKASALLGRLGCENVFFHVGDGTRGWPEAAPYDAVVVAAAAPAIPEDLKKQLAPGGRLVIPVGGPHGQMLTLVERTDDGFRQCDVCPCIFVRLIGEDAYEG